TRLITVAKASRFRAWVVSHPPTGSVLDEYGQGPLRPPFPVTAARPYPFRALLLCQRNNRLLVTFQRRFRFYFDFPTPFSPIPPRLFQDLVQTDRPRLALLQQYPKGVFPGVAAHVQAGRQTPPGLEELGRGHIRLAQFGPAVEVII